MTMTMGIYDEGQPGLRAEEHDFDEMYPPPASSLVTPTPTPTPVAEADPMGEDDDEDVHGDDWIE